MNRSPVTLEKMLERYRRAAVHAAAGGAYARPEFVEELTALRAQLHAASRKQGAVEWLESRLPAVRAEVEARLAEAWPDWWTAPPGWWVESLLAPGIFAQLEAAESALSE